MIKIKRVYEQPSKGDGFRILVDRLWPRGLTKERAAVNLWLREIAPSTDLRKWFSHNPTRWEEFRKMYVAELKGKKAVLKDMKRFEREKKSITLLYAAKDKIHNNAVVLQEILENK